MKAFARRNVFSLLLHSLQCPEHDRDRCLPEDSFLIKVRTAVTLLASPRPPLAGPDFKMKEEILILGKRLYSIGPTWALTNEILTIPIIEPLDQRGTWTSAVSAVPPSSISRTSLLGFRWGPCKNQLSVATSWYFIRRRKPKCYVKYSIFRMMAMNPT